MWQSTAHGCFLCSIVCCTAAARVCRSVSAGAVSASGVATAALPPSGLRAREGVRACAAVVRCLPAGLQCSAALLTVYTAAAAAANPCAGTSTRRGCCACTRSRPTSSICKCRRSTASSKLSTLSSPSSVLIIGRHVVYSSRGLSTLFTAPLRQQSQCSHSAH